MDRKKKPPKKYLYIFKTVIFYKFVVVKNKFKLYDKNLNYDKNLHNNSEC
jgi:hypothetical protein